MMDFFYLINLQNETWTAANLQDQQIASYKIWFCFIFYIYWYYQVILKRNSHRLNAWFRTTPYKFLGKVNIYWRAQNDRQKMCLLRAKTPTWAWLTVLRQISTFKTLASVRFFLSCIFLDKTFILSRTFYFKLVWPNWLERIYWCKR